MLTGLLLWICRLLRVLYTIEPYSHSTEIEYELVQIREGSLKRRWFSGYFSKKCSEKFYKSRISQAIEVPFQMENEMWFTRTSRGNTCKEMFFSSLKNKVATCHRRIQKFDHFSLKQNARFMREFYGSGTLNEISPKSHFRELFTWCFSDQ